MDTNTNNAIFSNAMGAVKYDKKVVPAPQNSFDNHNLLEDKTSIDFKNASFKGFSNETKPEGGGKEPVNLQPSITPEDDSSGGAAMALPLEKKADTMTYAVGRLAAGEQETSTGNPQLLFIEESPAAEQTLDIGDSKVIWIIASRSEATPDTEFFIRGLNSISSAKDGLFSVEGDRIA